MKSFHVFFILFIALNVYSQCPWESCSGPNGLWPPKAFVKDYPLQASEGFYFNLDIVIPPCLPVYKGRMAIVLALPSGTHEFIPLDTVNITLKPDDTVTLQKIFFPESYFSNGIIYQGKTHFTINAILLDNNPCSGSQFLDPAPDILEIYIPRINSLYRNSLLNESINLFPNPTSDFLEVNGMTTDEKVTLLTSQGVIIKQDIPLPVNVKSLPLGLYYLHIKVGNEGNTIKKSFIKN